MSGSQIAICFGKIGLKFRIPFIYRFTISCFPNDTPFSIFNNDDKADRAVATDEYPTPD